MNQQNQIKKENHEMVVEESNQGNPRDRFKLFTENMYVHFHQKYHDKFWWKKETVFLLVSLLIAGLATFLKHQDSQSREMMLQKLYSSKNVYVASKNIKSGDVLTQSNLKIESMLEKNITKNHIDVGAFKLVEGRVLNIDVLSGDAVMLSAINHKNAIRKMAQAVPAGKRLFTLSVQDESLQVGLIEPSDRVDVIAHMAFPDKGPTSFTILEDVTLIAIGAKSVFKREDSGDLSATSVSFFVDIKKSELLAFAQKHGSFSLSLRNKDDHAVYGSNTGVNHTNFLDSDIVSKASGGSDLLIKQK